jgi:hypothetical protein
MYSAFWVRFMTAGHDGCCGSGSRHCGALVWRDDGAERPDPGPDHFAVAFLGSLLSLPSIGFDRWKRECAFRSDRRRARRVFLARGEDRPDDPGGLGGCAITATFIGRLARMPRCHCVARPSRKRALRRSVTAPRANSLRNRLSPCRLKPWVRRLPADDVSRGVMPPQAVKSRPQANCRPSPIAPPRRGRSESRRWECGRAAACPDRPCRRP